MSDTNQAKETTGGRLARLRRAQNITQEALAEELNISRQAVSKWESDLAFPETDKLIALARLYGCTVDYLLTGEEPTPATASAPDTEHEDPNLFTRMDKAWGSRPRYFEFKSRRTWGKLPLVHINIGFGRRATGVIAVGLTARGILSVGLASAGILSVGLCSAGIISVGLLALGLLLAVGSIAAGGIAIGAIALGLFALGAITVGLCSVGALAVGHYLAVGDHAYGLLAIGQTVAEGRIWSSLGDLSLTEAELKTAISVLREHVPGWVRWMAEAVLRAMR